MSAPPNTASGWGAGRCRPLRPSQLGSCEHLGSWAEKGLCLSFLAKTLNPKGDVSQLSGLNPKP